VIYTLFTGKTVRRVFFYIPAFYQFLFYQLLLRKASYMDYAISLSEADEIVLLRNMHVDFLTNIEKPG
jgi:hypothetical protein